VRCVELRSVAWRCGAMRSAAMRGEAARCAEPRCVAARSDAGRGGAKRCVALRCEAERCGGYHEEAAGLLFLGIREIAHSTAVRAGISFDEPLATFSSCRRDGMPRARKASSL